MVSFLANYLATTLPRQMAVSDVNHELEVEDQLGQLAASFAASGHVSVHGVVLSQPLALGSQGIAPFAAPDGGSVSAVPNQTNASVSLGLLGTHYGPPSWSDLWRTNGACTAANTSNSSNVHCTGGATVTLNFNAPTGSNYTFTVKGAGSNSISLNFSSNRSTLSVTVPGRGGGFEQVTLLGNNNTATISGTGDSFQNVTVIGNGNQVTVAATSGARVNITIVGNHNYVAVANTPGSSSTVNVTGWGSYDTFMPGSGGSYAVNYTGFDPVNASSAICPYDDLAGTDSVVNFTRASESGNVTYNNATGGPNSTTPVKLPPGWTVIRQNDTSFACIFFATFNAAPASGLSAASVVVHLRNTYVSSAEVALDQGAVVYAQPGGRPFIVDPPPFTLVNGVASATLTAFIGKLGNQSGSGSAVLRFTGFSSQSYSFPGDGWMINPAHPLTVILTTPYYGAWMTYYCGLAGYASHISLTLPGVASKVTCAKGSFIQTFQDGGPLGTISLGLPAATVTLRLAVFVPDATM